MKTEFIYGAIVLCAIVLVWGFSKLVKACYNLKVLYREEKQPGNAPRSCGIVINKKTRKLEADNRPLLPFE